MRPDFFTVYFDQNTTSQQIEEADMWIQASSIKPDIEEI